MHLGVAQLVARYLGVVEAASSSLVTQTRKSPMVAKLSDFLFFNFTVISKSDNQSDNQFISNSLVFIYV